MQEPVRVHDVDSNGVTSTDLGGGKRGLDVTDPLSSDILTALELLLYGQEDTNLWLEIIANELEA